jgi:O-antigen ligase
MLSSSYYLPVQMLAHDMYIEFAAETGIFGLVAILWFIYIILRDLWSTLHAVSNTDLFPLTLGLFLATIAGFIISITSNIHGRDFYWTVLGLAYTTTLISTTSPDKRKSLEEK